MNSLKEGERKFSMNQNLTLLLVCLMTLREWASVREGCELDYASATHERHIMYTIRSYK